MAFENISGKNIDLILNHLEEMTDSANAILDHTKCIRMIINGVSTKPKVNAEPMLKTPSVRVVCVKVKDIRPEYHTLKEWVKDPNNLYIGRRGVVFIDGKRFPEKDSPWHNPFKIKAGYTREKVIDMYRNYILEKITNKELSRQDFELKGKTLGCWCHPDSCHSDVLAEIVNNLDKYF